MSWLRALGILCLLVSIFCFSQFQSQMKEVAAAKAEANRFSMSSSGDPGDKSKQDLAEAEEAGHRSLAKNWFLSGAALVAGGVGLLIVPAIIKRRAARTSNDKPSR
ncbi:MAG TPA: hypothetical protein VGZ22_08730 [Isosphaeraceae bacterium]|nr:hypothetical protein [Isosphaeraceae bacterium]